jgi:PAS domain S-box-containing protein
LTTPLRNATIRSVTGPVLLSTEPTWLRHAADAARVGFWHLDPATGIIECTARCKANLGIPQDTQVNIDVIWSIMHPDDREPVGARVQQAMNEHGAYDVKYRAIWPDGSVHHIASRGQYIEFDGRPALVGSTVDETERHRVEELNRLITTNVAEGLCLIDAHGRLTFLNPAGEEILGYSQDELLGRVLHESVHYARPDGSPYPMSECPLGGTLFGGAPVTDREDYWIRKDGAFVPVLCSSTPILDNGRVSGSVLSFHDSTERKAMEDALREASRARDEFLATVSHELRTPMTAILGWAQLMKMMSLSDELRMAVEQIELSAKAQAAIVDDLIDVSRAITGKLRLHVGPMDAIAVMNEAIHMVENSAAAKRIELARAYEVSEAPIVADRGRLHQVFWNLLANAIKFTPEGGRVETRISVSADRLTVAVTDSGIGIQPAFLPFVFDRFSQQSQSISRQHGGLGLGLAIVKQLVEMHGGTVSASSEGPDTGATFTVVLPRR